MSLRDDIETVLRSWNRYEVERSCPPVVDFDCHPSDDAVLPASDRLAVRTQLVELMTLAGHDHSTYHLRDRASAAIAYLDSLLGERRPVREYIRTTQGCDAHGWSDSHIALVRDVALKQLDHIGISWGADTLDDLNASEGPLDPASAADVIRQHAVTFEPDVRRLADTNAPFDLSIEHVDLDVYWAYWLDGTGANVRMRINSRRANFTDIQARQFALHEILGHGLQCASYAQKCQQADVPWVRITSVHAQQQVLLEGLAQALPLFLYPESQQLITRVRLAHYLELVRAKLHLAINDGQSIQECVTMARSLAPFWSDETVSDVLTDRSANPLLRTYLWAYPAGIDWFVRLADEGSEETIRKVLQTAYASPLTPTELVSLWPEGPAVGGDGEPSLI